MLEGIALVGNPDFAIIDEAYPYLAQRLLTDDSPRLRESLKYMVYGKSGVFDAERLIDLLHAFETFTVNSRSASGDLAVVAPPAPPLPLPRLPFPPVGAGGAGGLVAALLPPPPAALAAFGAAPDRALAGAYASTSAGAAPATSTTVPESWQTIGGSPTPTGSRAALLFLLSDSGTFFRTFLMDEIVRSIDALSRSQLAALVRTLRLQGVVVPVFLPLAKKTEFALSHDVSEEDQRQVESVAKLVDFLAGGSARNLMSGNANELMPLLPRVAQQIVPEVAMRLTGRIAARFVRTFYL